MTALQYWSEVIKDRMLLKDGSDLRTYAITVTITAH
jgi:hypothetical protein